MTPKPPNAAESKQDLRKAGWAAVLIALALQGIALWWIATARPGQASLVVGPLVLIAAIASVCFLAEGLATLAEAKGHLRWHGWWAPLSLLGLLIVLRLPDRRPFEPSAPPPES